MSKKLIITEEEKDDIKSLYRINEQVGYEEIMWMTVSDGHKILIAAHIVKCFNKTTGSFANMK